MARESTNWVSRQLGDLIQIKHGYAFKGQYFGDAGTHVVLTPGNFYEEGGFRAKEGKEKWYAGPVSPDYILEIGDLIVAMTEQAEGLLGSSALVPESNKYLHNQRLGLVTEKLASETDRAFLYYLFNSRSVREQIRASANGAKIRHTSPARIYQVEVRVPNADTQRRIASILSAYDDLIENNARRIAILEEMARRIYEEWFVRFRFPGHESVRMVESELGPVPQGWEQTALGKVAENHDRFRKPLSKMQREGFKGPYPYYGAAKIFDYVREYLFDGQFLLLAEDGSVETPDGLPVLQLTDGKFWANNHTHILRGTEQASTEYLYLRLEKQPIRGYVTGAAQPKLTQANINRIPVLLPPLGLMEQFTSTIKPMFGLRAVLLHKNANLRSTRDLLLQKLISGELDVSTLPEPQAAVA